MTYDGDASRFPDVIVIFPPTPIRESEVMIMTRRRRMGFELELDGP
jgi:hypothetical protein